MSRRSKGFLDKPTIQSTVDSASVPTELRLDASYRNTNDWKQREDVFNKLFRFSDGKGINNTSGFRPKSKNGGSTDILSCAFCALVTTFGETEWPDALDRQYGVFTYYGDNRSPGRPIAETVVGGNRLLESVFSRLHVGKRVQGSRKWTRCSTLCTPLQGRISVNTSFFLGSRFDREFLIRVRPEIVPILQERALRPAANRETLGETPIGG